MDDTPRRATRDRLLDAYRDLVAGSGPRAATLEAVAAGAGVSKGGLLYHFASKDALVEGLLARVRDLGERDREAMRAAPEGASAYYLRTSVVPSSGADELDRDVVVVLRLAQDGDARARAAYLELSEAWRELIEAEVGDRTLSRVVQLVGDGLWAGSTMGFDPGDLDVVVARVRELVGVRGAAG